MGEHDVLKAMSEDRYAYHTLNSLDEKIVGCRSVIKKNLGKLKNKGMIVRIDKYRRGNATPAFYQVTDKGIDEVNKNGFQY